MSGISISKAFALTINPEPTFDGLLWNAITDTVIGAGTTSWTASAGVFSQQAATNAPGGGAVLRISAGDGAGGTIVIPSIAQTRNCRIHVVTTVANPTVYEGAFDLYYNANHDGVSLSAIGSIDHDFILTGGVAYTFRLQLDMHVGEAGLGALTWNGYIYVQSYS